MLDNKMTSQTADDFEGLHYDFERSRKVRVFFLPSCGKEIREPQDFPVADGVMSFDPVRMTLVFSRGDKIVDGKKDTVIEIGDVGQLHISLLGCNYQVFWTRNNKSRFLERVVYQR